MLHGTSGSGAKLLTPASPASCSARASRSTPPGITSSSPTGSATANRAKPSDGLKAKFPHYDYADMVDAHYRLLTEGMGIRHLRLVMGNSMGGMHAWLWGGKYPDFMDALVPMASQPTAMSGRNWMMRRLIIDSVKNDPDWNGGNYTTQPKSVKAAAVFYGIATSGGTLAYAKLAPTREAADKMLDARLAAPFTADANDFLYQWAASGDYDPTPLLPSITAKLLLINAADDERNPPETGLTEKAMKQVKNGSLYLIPASEDTRGHGTTGNAKFYTKQLAEFLQGLPAAVRWSAARMEQEDPPRIAAMPLYTNLDRIARGLAAQGIGPGDPIRPEQLFALDQWHYHGTEAIAAAARAFDLGPQSSGARHRRGRRRPRALSRLHHRLPRHRARAAARAARDRRRSHAADRPRRPGDPCVRRRAHRAVARRGFRRRRELARHRAYPRARAAVSAARQGTARRRRLLHRRPLHAQAVRAARLGGRPPGRLRQFTHQARRITRKI